MTWLRSVLVLALVTSLVGIAGCGGPAQEADAGGRDGSAVTDSGEGPFDGAIDRDASGTPDADAGERPDAFATTDGGSIPGSGLVTAAEGGLVVSEDGLFEIHVMPGAITSDVTITITRVPDADIPADLAAESPLGGVYAVEPDGLVFAPGLAWSHAQILGIPSELIIAGSPTGYRTLESRSRPRDGGAIAGSPFDVTSIELDTDRVSLVAELPHLSYHYATASGSRNAIYATLPDGPQIVGYPFDWTDVRMEAEPTYYGRPLRDVVEYLQDGFSVLRGGFPGEVSISTGFRAPPGVFRGDLPLSETLSLGSGMSGTDPRTLRGASPRFVCLMPNPSVFAAVGFTLQYGDAPPHAAVFIGTNVICESPLEATIRIVEQTPCVREDAVVDCSYTPTPRAQVEVSAPTTQSVAAPSGNFVVTTPAGATPVAGPSTITATSGGATMTATRDETTGEYDEVFAGDAWQSTGESILVSVDAATAHVLSSPPAFQIDFGPLDGDRTDLILSGPDVDSESWVEVSLEMLGVDCNGSVEDLRVFGFDFPVDRDRVGTWVVEDPLHDLYADVASHCALTVDEVYALPATGRVATLERAVVDATTGPVAFEVGWERSFDADSLFATCPVGRTYCTDACVDTATDPMNCGGCGVTPLELCDTVDNDCDGGIDEGCPRSLLWHASSSLAGTFGGTEAGDSGASPGCAYPAFFGGICVVVDTTSGNIRQLGGMCANTTLVRPTAATPDEYEVRVSTPTACATGMALTCPANMLMDGLDGLQDPYIGQVRARCSSYDVQRSGDGTWAIVRTGSAFTATLGSGPGTPFSWVLPDASTTGFPGGIRSAAVRYYVPGVLTRLSLYGTWPTLGF